MSKTTNTGVFLVLYRKKQGSPVQFCAKSALNIQVDAQKRLEKLGLSAAPLDENFAHEREGNCRQYGLDPEKDGDLATAISILRSPLTSRERTDACRFYSVFPFNEKGMKEFQSDVQIYIDEEKSRAKQKFNSPKPRPLGDVLAEYRTDARKDALMIESRKSLENNHPAMFSSVTIETKPKGKKS
jgi:hypothetical protein